MISPQNHYFQTLTLVTSFLNDPYKRFWLVENLIDFHLSDPDLWKPETFSKFDSWNFLHIFTAAKRLLIATKKVDS